MRTNIGKIKNDGRVTILREQLRKMAYERGPNMKLPTTRELCNELGASLTTVFVALEELEAQNVICRKPGSGIYVSSKLFQKTIALVMGASTVEAASSSPFWDILWRLFIQEAQIRNKKDGQAFSLHVLSENDGVSQPLDDQLARLIETRQIDGILGVGLDFETSEWIKQRNVPVVSFGGNGVWQIVMDINRLIAMGVKSLSRAGCRHIQLWMVGDKRTPTFDPSDPWYHQRFDSPAFREAMDKEKLPYHNNDILSFGRTEHASLSHQEQGRLAVANWLEGATGTQAHGVIIPDDIMALGALRELDRRGLRQTVKVVAGSNKGLPILYAYEDAITRIEFDAAHLTAAMFEQMANVLRGEKLDQFATYIDPYEIS